MPLGRQGASRGEKGAHGMPFSPPRGTPSTSGLACGRPMLVAAVTWVVPLSPFPAPAFTTVVADDAAATADRDERRADVHRARAATTAGPTRAPARHAGLAGDHPIC